jgi:hypothetical protein
MKRVITAGVGVIAALLISATPGQAVQPSGTAGSAASMAMSTAERVVVPAMPGPGTSIVLSEKASKAIISALAAGGSSAALAICQTVVPAAFKDACTSIVAILRGRAVPGPGGVGVLVP